MKKAALFIEAPRPPLLENIQSLHFPHWIVKMPDVGERESKEFLLSPGTQAKKKKD